MLSSPQMKTAISVLRLRICAGWSCSNASSTLEITTASMTPITCMMSMGTCVTSCRRWPATGLRHKACRGTWTPKMSPGIAIVISMTPGTCASARNCRDANLFCCGMTRRDAWFLFRMGTCVPRLNGASCFMTILAD